MAYHEYMSQRDYGEHKHCRKCGCWWPATLDYWYEEKRKPAPFRTPCRRCQINSARVWYDDNISAVQEARRRRKERA